MKNYIGTKEILAKPMNRLQYNEYRGWELPSDEDGTDEGYLVEYKNQSDSNHPSHAGYISWSPKNVFEEAYRVSETYEDRLRIENKELAAKTSKLLYALENNKVPKEYVGILTKQLRIMEKYGKILFYRLDGRNEISSENLSFGDALVALKEGKCISRKGWNGKELFVCKQVPSSIDAVNVVPNMQSLPQSAKDIFAKRIDRGAVFSASINYENQMIIIKLNNTIDSWLPSSSDVFAEDWIIL